MGQKGFTITSCYRQLPSFLLPPQAATTEFLCRNSQKISQTVSLPIFWETLFQIKSYCDKEQVRWSTYIWGVLLQMWMCHGMANTRTDLNLGDLGSHLHFALETCFRGTMINHSLNRSHVSKTLLGSPEVRSDLRTYNRNNKFKLQIWMRDVFELLSHSIILCIRWKDPI